MVRPSEASWPAGMRRSNEVRYHDVPGVAVVAGTVVGAHDRSLKRGRYQPWRSPYRPPLLSGPRTLSAPVAPWIFQLTAAPRLDEISPRPSLCASLTPPSWLWPLFRTMTDSTCGP